MTWRLLDGATGRVVAARVRRADGWLERTLGFLPRAAIASDEGLWFPRTRAIHTLGMRVALDVVFVDRSGRVLRVETNVRPGRWHVGESGADAVAEFAAGFAAANGVEPGTVLELRPDEPPGA
ncbi:MAG TPA: DUF192 domain-containing protein [Candidatus Elarobacter sp.]|jgi:hypothetical protein|nr:DUF192 domain-containing protein [Candidatus Elarobacter sp.]